MSEGGEQSHKAHRASRLKQKEEKKSKRETGWTMLYTLQIGGKWGLCTSESVENLSGAHGFQSAGWQALVRPL